MGTGSSPAFYRFFPAQISQTPWVSLIDGPTPVVPMAGLSRDWKHPSLFVKREDLTDTVYGGNKVRNLEFILGEALHRQTSGLVTIAPLGSNFIAALAAQAKKLSLPVHVKHFVPVRSRQIEQHFAFSEQQGARMEIHEGISGTIPAALRALAAVWGKRRTQWVSPGGSSVIGALGHVNSFVEFLEQVERGESPLPNTLIVGAGTCGTIAGLYAAKTITGSPIQIIGVRCVDRIVCNRRHIARLANHVIRYLGFAFRINAGDIRLEETPVPQKYGVPLPQIDLTIDQFRDRERLILDTTYTSKVASYLEQYARNPENRNQRILYWHTYSPRATELTDQPRESDSASRLLSASC